MGFKVNQKSADFLTAVDTELLQATGVRYMEVFRDVYGGHSTALNALDSGATAASFAEATIAVAGFVNTDEYGELARPTNLRAAALIPFSHENPHWLRADGGSLVTPADESFFRISPVMADPDREDSWGFAVDRIDNADVSTDQLGRVVIAGDYRVERVANGIDIGEAIAAYELQVNADYSNDSRLGY